MDSSSLDTASLFQVAIQLPVVGLFAYVILKLFAEVKIFVADLLSSHKDERLIRDEEWRSWLTEQRTSYLDAIGRVTEKMDEHHSLSVQQSREILQLLRDTNGKH